MGFFSSRRRNRATHPIRSQGNPLRVLGGSKHAGHGDGDGDGYGLDDRGFEELDGAGFSIDFGFDAERNGEELLDDYMLRLAQIKGYYREDLLESKLTVVAYPRKG